MFEQHRRLLRARGDESDGSRLFGYGVGDRLPNRDAYPRAFFALFEERHLYCGGGPES